MNIKCLGIANRGEVAVRIIAACQELGIETVLLHSEADTKTLAYRLADRRMCIGPVSSKDSYLNKDAIISALRSSKADAVHPGFGFLSENPSFVEMCENENILFIGPPSEAMRQLGDKVQSKKIARSLGIPMVPSYDGEHQDVAFLVQKAEQMGFPVLVKASAGGGGRGMKILRNTQEAGELISSAQREAFSAFSNPKVFLEKYLDHAKHIEFQVFALSDGRCVHLNERECSIQRRYQKIVEEAPSPSLNEKMRKEMGQWACKMIEQTNYRGAATVEFLFQDGRYYFMEVNTRLQVEHPVTEMTMGVDLIKAQILTAAGIKIALPNSLRGHSIECRIYAENPYLGGIPSPGLLEQIRWPHGPFRRFDSGYDSGDEVTPHYDAMIAKVIVWDETRIRATSKMKSVLSKSIIRGVYTNIPYLLEILSHPEFENGTMTTQFIDQYFSKPLPQPENVDSDMISEFSDVISGLGEDNHSNRDKAASLSPFHSFWRVNATSALNNKSNDLTNSTTLSKERRQQNLHKTAANKISNKTSHKTPSLHPDKLFSPMPGKVTKLLKSAGDKVQRGDSILVLEAMKMEYTLKCEANGVIENIFCKEGETVILGQWLVKFVLSE